MWLKIPKYLTNDVKIWSTWSCQYTFSSSNIPRYCTDLNLMICIISVWIQVKCSGTGLFFIWNNTNISSWDRFLIKVKYVARLLACVTITATSSGGWSSSSEVTWQQFVIDGGSSYPWSRLMAGWQVLISIGLTILRRHILSSRAITLTSSILMGCSWSPTAVRGYFCFGWSFLLVSWVWAVSPTYCAGHAGHCFHRWHQASLSLGWTRMERRVLKGLW